MRDVMAKACSKTNRECCPEKTKHGEQFSNLRLHFSCLITTIAFSRQRPVSASPVYTHSSANKPETYCLYGHSDT